MLKAIGTRVLRGPVGEPLNTEIAVRYTDAAKDPKAGVAIVFTCDPPGAVLFNGRQYATVNTEDKDRKGVASVVGTIQRTGRFTIRAETAPNDEDHLVDFDIHSVDPVGVHRLGGDTMVTHPWGGPQTRNIPEWPIVAVLAILVTGAILWKVIDKPSASSGGPIVVHPPSVGPVTDPNASRALAEAQAAKAAVEERATELREEFGSGIAENSAHDQGYARGISLPIMRQALRTAHEVRLLLADGSTSVEDP